MIQSFRGRSIPNLLVACAVLTPALMAQSTKTTETQRFVGQNDEFQDFYGRTAAVSDGWLFIGAPNEPAPCGPPDPRAGVVYVYRRGLGGWAHVQTLESPSVTAHSFGDELAVSGDILVVGDFLDSWAVLKSGKVLVFELVDGRWIFRQELVGRSPGLPDGFGFGSSVAVDGDRIAVGEPGEDSLGLGYDNGAVHVFDRGPTGWDRTACLLPVDRPGMHAGGFGARVAVSGDQLLSQVGGSPKQVQVFELGPQGWEYAATLVRPGGSPHDHFGDATAIDGDWIAIGEPAIALVFPPRLGKVAMFEHTGSGPFGGWELRQTLYASNGSSSGFYQTDSFGYSLDLQGRRLVVGARYGFSGAGHPHGQAYHFELGTNGKWTETWRFSTKAAESGQTQEAGMGWDVAVSDSVVLVGAPTDYGRSGTVSAGSAYVHELPLGTSDCPGASNSTGGGATLTVTGVAKAGVNGVTARAEDLPRQAFAFVLAAQSNGIPVMPPGSQGWLCLGDPIRRLGHTLSQATPTGSWTAPLDLPQVGIDPQPGDTWIFQLWYRDANPHPTSNLTNTVRVTWH